MPQLWGVAGPNGAGKSTLTSRYLAGRLQIVNPDVIAREKEAGSNALVGIFLLGHRRFYRPSYSDGCLLVCPLTYSRNPDCNARHAMLSAEGFEHLHSSWN